MRIPELAPLLDSAPRSFAVWFALLIALNAGTFSQPPVWDSAASIFPAALFLYENGFDLPELLRQPGYYLGGPNVHSYSIVMHATAGIFFLTGAGAATFPLLHLLHFALAAWALAGFVSLARRLVSDPHAVLLTLCVVAFPLFLTQTRYMYLEIPLFACSVAALRAQIDHRLVAAALWGGVACVVKEAGLVVGVCVAALWLLEAGPVRPRLLRAASALAPVLAFVVLHSAFVLDNAAITTGGIAFGAGMFGEAARAVGHCWSRETSIHLSQIPDTAAMTALCLLVATVRWRALGTEPVARAAAVLVAGFVGFHYGVLPATGMHCSVLPRYFVQILPFVLLLLGWSLSRIATPRSVTALLCACITYGVINRDGALYPSELDRHGPGVSFAETERSGAYRQLLAAERAGLALLEQVPADVPIYNELHHQYVVERPALGYVSRRLDNSRYIQIEYLERGRDLRRFPACFIIDYFSPNLGGTALRSLVAQAERLPAWRNELLAETRSGPYRSRIFKLWRVDTDCLSDFSFRRDEG